MSFFQPLKRVSAKSLSWASSPNLLAKRTMGGGFDSVCESNVDSPRLQTGSWWGSNQEGGATNIDLEAMETAALWNGVEKPNNRFPPPFHRAWKTLRPKTLRVSHSSTASATTDPIAFSQKLYQGGLARFISVVTVEDSTPRASRNSHCHAAGKYAISKKLKPMQFLFSCNKPKVRWGLVGENRL